jgi:hypothetical protein
MSGVAVIVALLKANTPVTAVVPAARIMAGDAPIDTPKPLIVVTQISSVPEGGQIRRNEPNRVHSDRVQVSYLFDGPQADRSGTGYPGLAAMSRLVLAACPSQRGTINGVAVNSIESAGEGPDLSDAATGLYSRSRDFLVRWTGD